MHPLISVPVTLALVIRAYSHNSLTIPGIILAVITASCHALHPSALPFTLLIVFFLLGTAATKVKHEVKATLTLSSSGSAGGEGPRTSIQVLANSGIASVLCLIHAWKYGTSASQGCFGNGIPADLLMVGIIANYAAVTADTLSSELGILSKGQPRLITTLKSVPPGTNGGVTLGGILAGAAGGAVIGLVSILMLDFCAGKETTQLQSGLNSLLHRENATWGVNGKVGVWIGVTVWGTLGSLLDSLLGAALQASVVDRRTGKVVEGAGGKVLVVSSRSTMDASEKKNQVSRSIGSGRDILDNNQINILMAAIMSVGGILVGSSIFGIDLSTISSY